MDVKTAITLKLSEFDKLIAESKASAAALEAKKASFIYENNLKAIAAMDQKKEEEGQENQKNSEKK